ncbi:MAG: IclR family transcriptional regulator [Paraglaciecola chathamensis]|jgi:DNA-binding IclR family transcriptional regulator
MYFACKDVALFGTACSRENVKVEKQTGLVQSVSVSMRFLKVLNESDSPLPLGKIAKRAEAGASMAHRYLQTLVKEGMVSQDPATGFYDLGPQAIALGISAIRRISPIEIASEQMKLLAETTQAGCGIAIWTQRGPALIRWYKSAYFSLNPLSLGEILPLDNTACGLMFQAYMHPSAIQIARDYQPEHFSGKPPAAEQLEQIRESQFLALKSYLLPEITGQAAPVFNAQGDVVCLITSMDHLGHQPDAAVPLKQAGQTVAGLTGTECFWHRDDLLR